MTSSFASEKIAGELSSGSYPLVSSLWTYRSTAVRHDQLPAVRAEVVTLVKAVLKAQIDQAVVDELDDLLVFLKHAEGLGLGVTVEGP